MSHEERVKRPPLERTGPIRGLDGLWGRPASAASITESGQPSREKVESDTSGSVEDVVSRSVELAYKVVDDYMRRGQEAAQRIRHGTYGTGEIAEDVQGVAGQLARSAADLVGAWTEFFALAGRDITPSTASSETRREEPTPEPSVGESAVREALRVRLVVAATRPLETSLDVRSIPADHRLVVYALRGTSSTAARIDDVRVEGLDDGTAVIRVRVPAEQVPDSYRGLIVDDTSNVPVGELVVVVPPAG